MGVVGIRTAAKMLWTCWQMAQAGPLLDQKVVPKSSIKIGKTLSIISQTKLSDPKEFLPRTREVSTKSIRTAAKMMWTCWQMAQD
jgi:hypothetical protein